MVRRSGDHDASVRRRDDEVRRLRHLALGIPEEICQKAAQQGERCGDGGTFGHRRDGGRNQCGADDWEPCAIDLHTGRMPYNDEEGQWPERALGKARSGGWPSRETRMPGISSMMGHLGRLDVARAASQDALHLILEMQFLFL